MLLIASFLSCVGCLADVMAADHALEASGGLGSVAATRRDYHHDGHHVLSPSSSYDASSPPSFEHLWEKYRRSDDGDGGHGNVNANTDSLQRSPSFLRRRQGIEDASDDAAALVETGAKAGASARAGYVTEPGAKIDLSTLRVEETPNAGCEVCVHALENKNNNQPFLCRNIRHPKYQQDCVNVLVSLMWWLQSQTYWIHFGCFQNFGSTGAAGKSNDWRWVKPCPPHAVCSWIKNIYDQQPYCPPADDSFAKPQE